MTNARRQLEAAWPSLHGARLALPMAMAGIAIIAAVEFVVLPQSRFPAEGSPEAGFARDMSTHHSQAVEMALITRDRTTNPELHALATDIMLTQQSQIGMIQGWLDVWGLPATGRELPMTWMGHPTVGLMPGMAMPTDIARLHELPPREMGAAFLQLMIPHHQAGVAMAEAILQRSGRPEVRRLAQAIVTAQQTEIQTMQDLLQRQMAN